jgi:EARP and GARP complex-interacting protein 1
LAIHETIQCATWNPHHDKTIAFGAGTHIIEWDIKSNQLLTRIEHAHEVGVRNLDYNQNKPRHIVSCGDDSMVRIWDSRNVKKPLMEMSDHTHWVWSVQFNKFHDQLLLSCSSDSQVNLQSVVSISSVPVVESDGDTPRPVDGLISSFDQHEDSVYCVAWSPSDPWIFASVSFDGRIVVNFVPQDHKYKIIL